jgi:2,3-bisphosphoglycerate-dependent phosphoglycerate mutase
VVERLRAQHAGEHLVLSTHGNLMALVLQYYDPCIDYQFWRELSMPDVYRVRLEGGAAPMTRLWQRDG